MMRFRTCRSALSERITTNQRANGGCVDEGGCHTATDGTDVTTKLARTVQRGRVTD